jgi:hypothetical protein
VALDLGRNDWAELPASFYSMPNRGNLRWLSVTHNGLKGLAPGIGEFTGVRVLDLTDNKLKQLPDEIGSIQNLVQCELSQNLLSDLPSGFANLSQLTELFLGSNQFHEFPNPLRHLHKLGLLFLGYNQLHQVPNWIGELQSLYDLSLNQNMIEILPDEILNIPTLSSVCISPKWLHPFFKSLRAHQPVADENYDELLAPNQHSGMIGRWKNFIPTILDKIQKNLPLDAWEQQYPFFAKYEQILFPVCEKHTNSTAVQVKQLIERTKNIKISKKKKIML